MAAARWILGVAAACLLTSPVLAGERVVSLDQCADQYVLALSPRADIVGLSRRADDADAWLRKEARGLPLRRVSAESVLAARPTLVVRYWGGDGRMDAMLKRRGVRTVRIDEASDFNAVRANIRKVAAAMNQPARGEALITGMDGKLAAAQGRWQGAGALYMTPGGFTAGKGTLVDAILAAAGLTNLAPGAGYAAVPLEAMVFKTPQAFVLGFFDSLENAMERWAPGRHRVLQRRLPGRTIASLPGSMLGCPAWFAADGALDIAKARPTTGP
ncbi:iron complex transport system substrate-binding protein [Caulobacter ginsengisoli]|uniref:Iron complex transport system substrate-binding protein n=1 Tax=Caulobacter ginsengisoli TaxID=400775 RepID=A0ABU0IMS8_9CAUL|nr:ABC transporter substrate-binding protein [Caulobacter ginsengisoli]MDQ0463314.1 iron complex transport system substrate-binding protein [Caulobacter ginsengisoli]